MMSDIYTGGMIDDIIDNMSVPYHYRADLKEEVMLILLTYDKEKIAGMYSRKELNFFTARIIRNQWHSKNSSFWKNYRKLSIISDGYEKLNGAI